MDKSLLEVAYETAKGLYKIGLMDKEEFDKFCLPPKKTKHQEVKKLRLHENLNRPVFTGKPVKNIRVAQH